MNFAYWTIKLGGVDGMGHVIAGSDRRWPNGIIPYTINEDDFPPGNSPERVAIEAAVTAWNTSTNITLRLRQPVDAGNSYVEFVAGDDSTTCNSPVGRQHGVFGFPRRQEIECNLSANVLIHEIGHAVGLFHEHQRDDRDWHVIVTDNNAYITGDRRTRNFGKKGEAGDDIGTYDFASVMHYDERTFAVSWLNGARIPLQRSSFRPALAAFDGALHMVHLGVAPSTDLWHAKWTPDGGWTDDEPIGGQQSRNTPAIGVFNNELHMVHSGRSNPDELWHTTFPAGGALGRDWSPNVEIRDQKSRNTPAIAVFNNELHMVHSGRSNPDELWHTTFPAGGALGRDWSPNARIEDQRSLSVPALCEFGGLLHLSYVGAPSTTMWHSTFFNGGWTPRDSRDNNRPPLGPALAEFAGSLHAAFVGDGSRIYHSMKSSTVRTIVPPAGVSVGLDALSPGDIATVAFMYP
jgi:Astacin (Peptidase family M12A)